MNRTHEVYVRIRTREEALKLLQRLTLGAAVGSVAAVAVFAGVSAATIPGTQSQGPSANATNDPQTFAGSGTAYQPPPDLGSSSQRPIAVSGGS